MKNPYDYQASDYVKAYKKTSNRGDFVKESKDINIDVSDDTRAFYWELIDATIGKEE